MSVTCDILLFLHCPCPWIGQGKNRHFILDSNLGYVKIIQEQWQCTQCSKLFCIKCMAHWNRYMSSFLGKIFISHFSLEQSTVMPWNRSSCPWNTSFKAVSSTAVIALSFQQHTVEWTWIYSCNQQKNRKINEMSKTVILRQLFLPRSGLAGKTFCGCLVWFICSSIESHM
jgi:hypothetical protein